MNQTEYENYLKTFKKHELIKYVMKFDKELAKCKADFDACKTELKEQSAKLKELEEFKKETDNWSHGFIKTLLCNKDNRKLFVSELEENINSVIDTRVLEKLRTEVDYYDGERFVDVLYDGNAV